MINEEKLGKEKIDFGFIVLHYQTEEMTVKCVDTLITLIDKTQFKCFIAVIDNFSLNGSGEKLKEKFSNDNRIKVILSEENLGFARGNNLGFSYIKDNFDADFIIDMNSDVLIRQSDFLQKVKKIYTEEKFVVLGPDIYIPKKGLHQSPIRIDSFSIEEAVSSERTLKKQLLYYPFYYIKSNVSIFLKKSLKKDKEAYKRKYSSCILQGSCYIFSKDFIQKRNYAFNPCTFMFFEEYILNYEVRSLFPNNENVMLYNPEIMVEHIHNVAISSIFSSGYKKSKWKDKNCLNSLQNFIETLPRESMLYEDKKNKAIKLSINTPGTFFKLKLRHLVNKIASYHITTQNLLHNALYLTESGVDSKSDLIVSLTTYGKYINDVHLAIESLLEQCIKPKKIILWISDATRDEDIPNVLRLQEKRGLEIRKTKDIRSYKKLIPTLKEFPNNPIITFDDDCIYPFDAIETLYKNYKENPKLIYFRVGRKLELKRNNSFKSYTRTEKRYLPEISPLNFPVGCGGVLYPPHCFDDDVFDEKTFMSICPTADDIWFKAMSLKNGVLSKGVYVHGEPYVDIDIFFENQSGRLNATNVDKKANDKQLKEVWDKYNLWGGGVND